MMPTHADVLIVNGEATSLSPFPATVQSLLLFLGHPPAAPGVAVAVNDEFVPRNLWESHRLRPNDAVEIVTARQGG